jgi:hypothetical protein
MSEASMVEMMREAHATRGIHEELVAVGQFNPRGHVGGLFAGGMVGSEAGGLLGGAATTPKGTRHSWRRSSVWPTPKVASPTEIEQPVLGWIS